MIFCMMRGIEDWLSNNQKSYSEKVLPIFSHFLQWKKEAIGELTPSVGMHCIFVYNGYIRPRKVPAKEAPAAEFKRTRD